MKRGNFQFRAEKEALSLVFGFFHDIYSILYYHSNRMRQLMHEQGHRGWARMCIGARWRGRPRALAATVQRRMRERI
jgi:hypothetical protein